jgi:hypothetical protein
MSKGTRKPARKSGWQQWTGQEARRVLKAWRASGLPLATFARRRGLCAERVRWWQNRLSDGSAPSAEALRLVPAVVTGLPPVAGGAVVTLRAPGDVVVEVTDVGAVPAAWLSALVSGLGRRAP